MVVTSTSGAGPDPENAAPEIEANTISGSLFCDGNSPDPTNDGKPNSVTGDAAGQCAGI